jgi:hypothetical protein
MAKKKSRTLPNLTIPLLATLALLAVFFVLSQVPAGGQANPSPEESSGLRPDANEIAQIWTRINTEECLTFSYYYALELEAIGLPISGQPSNLKNTVDGLAKVDNVAPVVTFLENTQIANAFRAAIATLQAAVPGSTSDDVAACVKNGPIGDWWIGE